MDNYFLQNYKICKYFLQNLLQKVFYTKYCCKKICSNFLKFFFAIFFYNKICKYFLQKKIQNKIGKKYEFFTSVTT